MEEELLPPPPPKMTSDNSDSVELLPPPPKKKSTLSGGDGSQIFSKDSSPLGSEFTTEEKPSGFEAPLQPKPKIDVSKYQNTAADLFKQGDMQGAIHILNDGIGNVNGIEQSKLLNQRANVWAELGKKKSKADEYIGLIKGEPDHSATDEEWFKNQEQQDRFNSAKVTGDFKGGQPSEKPISDPIADFVEEGAQGVKEGLKTAKQGAEMINVGMGGSTSPEKMEKMLKEYPDNLALRGVVKSIAGLGDAAFSGAMHATGAGALLTEGTKALTSVLPESEKWVNAVFAPVTAIATHINGEPLKGTAADLAKVGDFLSIIGLAKGGEFVKERTVEKLKNKEPLAPDETKEVADALTETAKDPEALNKAAEQSGLKIKSDEQIKSEDPNIKKDVVPVKPVEKVIEQKKNGEPTDKTLNELSVPKEDFHAALDDAKVYGELNAEQIDELKQQFDDTQIVKDKLPDEHKNNSELIDLVKEKQNLEQKKDLADDSFHPSFDRKIEEVKNKILEITDPKSIVAEEKPQKPVAKTERTDTETNNDVNSTAKSEGLPTIENKKTQPPEKKQIEAFEQDLVGPLKKEIKFYEDKLKPERLKAIKEISTKKEYDDMISHAEKKIADNKQRLSEIEGNAESSGWKLNRMEVAPKPEVPKEEYQTIRRGNPVPKERRKIKNPRALEALNIETQNPHDQALQYFIRGGQLHPAALDELYGGGGKNIVGEKRARIGLISNRGLGIDAIAHSLWENRGENNHYETRDYRNAVEEVINSHAGKRTMIDELLDKHGKEKGDSHEELLNEQAMSNVPSHIDLTDLPHEEITNVSNELPDTYQDAINEILSKHTNEKGEINWNLVSDYLDADSKDYFPTIPDYVKNKLISLQNESESAAIRPEEKGHENISPDVSGEIKKDAGRETATTLADRIRKGKIDKDIFTGGVPFAKEIWNGAIEVAAKSVEAGAKVAEAIKLAIDHIKASDWYKGLKKHEQLDVEKKFSEYMSDATNESTVPKSESAKEKSLLGRVYEGKTPQQIKASVEKYGLNYEVESHVDAERKASDYIKEVGIDNALKSVRNNEVEGGAAPFVWASAIDAIHKEYLAEENPELKAGIAEKEAALIKEFDERARSSGRFGSALQAVYQVSDLGYKLGGMINRAVDANGGETIPEILKNRLSDLSVKLDEVNKKMSELENQKENYSDKRILEEVEKEINKIFSKMPTERRKKADKVIAALDNFQKTLSSKSYSQVIPITPFIDAGISVIKLSIKAGVNLADAIELGINHIKEKYGQKWEKEDEFRKDISALFGEEEFKGTKDELTKFKNTLKRSKEKYEKRLSEKDFSPKTKKESPLLDKEAFDLQVEKNKLKDEVDLEVEKLRLKNRPMTEKVMDSFVDVVNLPKSLMASGDLSAPLRQGSVLGFSHPIIGAKSFAEMMRQAFSEKKAIDWLTRLRTSPEYQVMKKAGLYISEPTVKLAAKEEQFISNLASKIPGWGRIVKGSERAYGGFLNKLRVDVFSQFHDALVNEGFSGEQLQNELKSYADFVNNASGRGGLGKYSMATPLLNGFFFSPRYAISRFNLLNPIKYIQMSPMARVQALKTVGTYIGIGAMTLAIAKAGGAEVNADPRSSDFGKIKIGSTRFDVWAGLQQWVRLISQLATGKKTTLAGKVVPLGGTNKADTRLDVVERFLRSKASPTAGAAMDVLSGSNVVGQPITYKFKDFNSFSNTKEGQLIVPLWMQDISDAAQNGSPGMAAASGLGSFFGVGVQNFDDKKHK